ncbi:hypothetical protein CK203_075692 [Vitis vinifera]|uniref:Reverse transcriptase domain-containing protein n=1 Tax=Vitis vinifera TaxID=29760 RepID=A0A438EGL0_VITVI|nr:hypothetical protein CK203_075692 [Vitis vinifera]
MCGRGARSWVQILLLVKYLDLHGASCYGHGQHPEVWVSMESFKSLTMECFLGLEKPFTEEEVFGALSGFSGGKAPSPNGFSMAFCLNATFLVLISKKGGMEDLRDFRPISLVGGLYKWLTKVLANRLKRVLAKVRDRGGDGVMASHLLFADDTLVFCEARDEHMVFLCWLLMWFEAIPRLRVNMDKSKLIPVGRVENVEDLASELGC